LRKGKGGTRRIALERSLVDRLANAAKFHSITKSEMLRRLLVSWDL
jgi:hypothetical protein